MQKYNLRLSDEEYKDLKKWSAQVERSINELIREAIRDWLVGSVVVINRRGAEARREINEEIFCFLLFNFCFDVVNC